MHRLKRRFFGGKYMKEQGREFMEKYNKYLVWKQRREELFPEFREPKKRLKRNSWHYQGCLETRKIGVDRFPISPRYYVIYNLPAPSEIQICLECGAISEV